MKIQPNLLEFIADYRYSFLYQVTDMLETDSTTYVSERKYKTIGSDTTYEKWGSPTKTGAQFSN